MVRSPEVHTAGTTLTLPTLTRPCIAGVRKQAGKIPQGIRDGMVFRQKDQRWEEDGGVGQDPGVLIGKMEAQVDGLSIIPKKAKEAERRKRQEGRESGEWESLGT